LLLNLSDRDSMTRLPVWVGLQCALFPAELTALKAQLFSRIGQDFHGDALHFVLQGGRDERRPILIRDRVATLPGNDRVVGHVQLPSDPGERRPPPKQLSE
jgi:hypothetical protein